MKVKVRVRCDFDIEYEDMNDNIEYTKENIQMATVGDLLDFETEDSIQLIKVISIKSL